MKNSIVTIGLTTALMMLSACGGSGGGGERAKIDPITGLPESPNVSVASNGDCTSLYRLRYNLVVTNTVLLKSAIARQLTAPELLVQANNLVSSCNILNRDHAGVSCNATVDGVSTKVATDDLKEECKAGVDAVAVLSDGN